jgi:tRNA1Val (adenine37-N6)-methyltransferase
LFFSSLLAFYELVSGWAMADSGSALPGGILLREGETVDEILGGRLLVIQQRRGYRFSVDALLLAHFVRMRTGSTLLDLGTGSAVIPMILCRRWHCARAAGLELQEELAEMAGRSLELNGLADTIAIIPGDVRAVAELVSPRSFDVVTLNPPYRKLRSGRINPLAQKARARHELDGGLSDFLVAAAYAVRPSGSVCAIYPARRMAELIFQMRRHHLEPKRMQLVHSRREGEGEFVLMEGRPAGGEELKVLPPLFIYEADGTYTPAMQDVFNGLSASPGNAGG